MQGTGLLNREWDHIFIKDPHGVEKLNRLGLNVSLLHEAMNPHWHCPVTSRKNEEIVVAGSFYGYRHALVLRLLEEEVKMGLYGRRLPRWCDQKIVSIHRNQFVTRKDKSRIFGEALGCLNSTALTEGNSLNCRAFEIAGAGGLQFLEHRAIIEKCFEPGVEVCTFDSVDELLELIDRAKKEPKWAESIRKASASRALAEHTYAHRLEYIFKKLF
jgi:spore maturation protein CgeB